MTSIGKTLLLCGLLFSSIANSDEDYQHFPAIGSPDMKTAVCNLKAYNQKLAALTSKDELSTADMVKVHELTYTLENALARIQEDLTNVAANLEKVHKGSEKLEQDTVKGVSFEYFEQLNVLLNSACD